MHIKELTPAGPPPKPLYLKYSGFEEGGVSLAKLRSSVEAV